MNRRYCRTFSYPNIWDDFFNTSFIPDGYKLVEEDKHKKERLEGELEGLGKLYLF